MFLKHQAPTTTTNKQRLQKWPLLPRLLKLGKENSYRERITSTYKMNNANMYVNIVRRRRKTNPPFRSISADFTRKKLVASRIRLSAQLVRRDLTVLQFVISTYKTIISTLETTVLRPAVHTKAKRMLLCALIT